MAEAAIYRDSLSAWKGLAKVGGLEPEGRDSDLAGELKNQLDRGADTLESALRAAPVDAFVQALFRLIQPFPMMFADVLRFFEKAGAREGKTQWRVVLEDDVVELCHFQEFIERWENITCELDVPAIDQWEAFLPNTVRLEVGSGDYLFEDHKSARDREMCGIDDVDEWLALYDRGTYGPLPETLRPDRLPPGFDDAARIVLAALDVIRRQWSDREAMFAERSARGAMPDPRDGLNRWTIVQNETDYWLRNTVVMLGRVLTRPAAERERFGAELVARYGRMGRRLVNADVEVADLEKLLSLPAWQKRHELYGVWVATEMLASVEDHEIDIHHTEGELRFGFGEARVADIRSARPEVSLYAERRTPLEAPVGKGRTGAVQPDFGLWREGREPEQCALVVEVKHYKRRARRNFRDALIDYAKAHPRAPVLLVNYGPVGSFEDLPASIARRCEAIGYLNPQDHRVRADFRERVRACVGEPARTVDAWLKGTAPVVAVDVSLSMRATLRSAWFERFVSVLDSRGVEEVELVDTDVRDTVRTAGIAEWLRKNRGGYTALWSPVSRLADRYGRVLVVTDDDGIEQLERLEPVLANTDADENLDVQVAVVER